MLRNLFVGNMNADLNKHTLVSYFQALRMQPAKLAGMLAMFIVPIGALGWWCYSFVLSVGAMEPLQSTAGASSEVSLPESSPSSDASVNVDAVTSSLPESSGTVDVDVNSNSSQTTVKIDGQTVPLTDQGTIHQVIQNDNSQTTVDVNIDSDTTGTTKSRSSTNINLHSSSSADVDIRTKEIR